MTGSDIEHGGIGAGVGALAGIILLAALGSLKKAWAKWLLLATAMVGLFIGYFAFHTNNTPAITLAPTIPNNVPTADSVGTIEDKASQASGVTVTPASPPDQPASTLSQLYQQTLYENPNGTPEQRVQTGINQGIQTMEHAGVSTLDAQTVAGTLAMYGAQQIASAGPSTSVSLQDILQAPMVVGPLPPAQSNRPISGQGVMDLGPLFQELKVNPSQGTLLNYGAYEHNDQVVKH